MTFHAQIGADQAPGRAQGRTEESGAILLSLVMTEIEDAATKAQLHGFLVSVGHRIARIFPLPDRFDLAALEDGMNMAWHALGAGQVRLWIEPEGIGIRHELPSADGSVGRLWRGAGPALLEGAYAGWFAGLGEERLALTRLEDAGDTIGFRYGR